MALFLWLTGASGKWADHSMLLGDPSKHHNKISASVLAPKCSWAATHLGHLAGLSRPECLPCPSLPSHSCCNKQVLLSSVIQLLHAASALSSSKKHPHWAAACPICICEQETVFARLQTASLSGVHDLPHPGQERHETRSAPGQAMRNFSPGQGPAHGPVDG